MSLSKESKTLISNYVSRRKEGYNDLTLAEKTELISSIILSSSEYEKASLFSDYDAKAELPTLIGKVIRDNASFDSVKNLIDMIMDHFVYKPAFRLDINEVFEEEWEEQWPEPNEHWIHDCIQRSNDIRAG
jgi:hypothetical protein